MPTPVISQSVNPSDITTKLPGKPQRPGDINVIVRDLQDRVEKLENVLHGGVLLTSPNGTITLRLVINNSGALTLVTP